MFIRGFEIPPWDMRTDCLTCFAPCQPQRNPRQQNGTQINLRPSFDSDALIKIGVSLAAPSDELKIITKGSNDEKRQLG
jgi:hypothetical protein